mmetsp:Transcript_33093/g.37568  ORF Transcript_33093/g.37568 Transcript_33093/m.37568 type:complete len:96 (+) Transcript_33093:188-475(+)
MKMKSDGLKIVGIVVIILMSISIVSRAEQSTKLHSSSLRRSFLEISQQKENRKVSTPTANWQLHCLSQLDVTRCPETNSWNTQGFRAIEPKGIHV